MNPICSLVEQIKGECDAIKGYMADSQEMKDPDVIARYNEIMHDELSHIQELALMLTEKMQ